ncbi:MAG: hypothetical protein P8Y54_04865 [Xanthomonadales bacterium]
MKYLVPLLTAALAFPLNAFGNDNCQYIGSWFGYDANDNVSWTSQAVGSNSAAGTMLLELPGFDVTFGGLFDVVNVTGNLKGAWARTGGNTFSYAAMGFATDVEGDAVWAVRLTGDVTVTGDCDVLEVENTWMSIFILDPENDPVPVWGRTPDIGPMPFPPHNGYRIEP